MDATAANGWEEARDVRELSKECATEAGPVVSGVLVAPLRGALWELVAEGLPPEAIEGTLGQLLARLRVGVEQLRPT